MVDLRRHSFGSTAGITTSMGLIAGLNATAAMKVTVLASLLIVGVADNLTDALAIHVYQESEGLAEPKAFRSTIANFLTRLVVTISFLTVVMLTPESIVVPLALAWGLTLLSGLSYLLARVRAVSAWAQMFRHAVVAVAVILISRLIGKWILTWTH